MNNEQEKPKRKVRRYGADSAPTVYANSVNIAVSQIDMRVRFAQIDIATETEIVYKDVVTVFMTPAQARALRKLLNDKAAEHEARWAIDNGPSIADEEPEGSGSEDKASSH